MSLAGDMHSAERMHSGVSRMGASRLEVLGLAAVAAFAIAQQCLGHQNTDNSWLITVCEKILDGARPYVDIIETNPPASFLIYMPAVAFARLIGMRPELAVGIFAFANIAGCVALWVAILRRAGLLDPSMRTLAAIAGIFALAVVPSRSFAEREHFAAIWCLPIVAIYAARAAGAPPARWLAVAAGLLAGLAISVKPHFALPVAMAFLAGASWRRPFAGLVASENLAAAALALTYAASVPLAFPAFVKLMPMILDAYVPAREPLLDLLAQPWFLINVVLLAIASLIAARAGAETCAKGLIAASLGFALSYVWQGKGWPNHALPGVSLACLAVFMAAARGLAEVRRTAASELWARIRMLALFVAMPFALCAPVAFGAQFQWNQSEERQGLAEAVLRHAPAHPRLIALSQQLSAGHPVVRRLDGVWVGSTHSLLMTYASRLLIAAYRGDDAYRARLAAYAADDAARFLADVRAGDPDVILVDRDPLMLAAVSALPDLAAALEGYAPTETVADMVVWARRGAGGK